MLEHGHIFVEGEGGGVRLPFTLDFPDDSAVKKSACNAGDTGDKSLIPGSGRSLRGWSGSPLRYSCLEDPMDRGAWWATVQRDHKESDMTEHQHRRYRSNLSGHQQMNG